MVLNGEDHNMNNGSREQYIYIAFAELPINLQMVDSKSYYK